MTHNETEKRKLRYLLNGILVIILTSVDYAKISPIKSGVLSQNLNIWSVS